MAIPSSEGVAPTLRRPGAARLLDWRLPAIETWPAVVAFVQTIPGKLVLFAVFAGLMKVAATGIWIDTRGMWLLMTIAAAVVSLAGRHRHVALLLCTGALLVYFPDWFDFRPVHATIHQEKLFLNIRESQFAFAYAPYVRVATLAACVPLAVLAIWLARRLRDHPLGRRPVLAQHFLYFCLLGLAASRLLTGLPQVWLWSLIAVFSAYFWFLAYALIDQRHRQPAPLSMHLALFNPFAYGWTTPVGRGAADWLKVEANAGAELAITQLKGLKLLVWALILKVVLWAFGAVVYGKLGIPHVSVAFDKFLRGGDVPAAHGLAGVIVNFPEQLLIVAIFGHVFIAIARLAGFRLLRNTWRPLSARTIAEFWNRFFYYFKEVLVHVYFYPTYLRCFKRHPRLRLAFATFMAAGIGNFFFHFIFLNHHAVVRFGLLEALARAQSYAFYCLLLVIGIVASQLRARRPDPGAGWLRGRFVPCLGVAAFFCLLSFFDTAHREASVAQHVRFLLHIFRIDRWILATG